MSDLTYDCLRSLIDRLEGPSSTSRDVVEAIDVAPKLARELLRQRDAFDAGARLNGDLRGEVERLSRELAALRAAAREYLAAVDAHAGRLDAMRAELGRLSHSSETTPADVGAVIHAAVSDEPYQRKVATLAALRALVPAEAPDAR